MAISFWTWQTNLQFYGMATALVCILAYFLLAFVFQ
jgi:hypothetical protein